MGVVYAADDARLGRRVALKFLPRELSADSQAVERFQREARAAFCSQPSAHLHHSRHRIDREFDGTQHYIVMEMLEGQTLKHLIGGKPRSIALSLNWRFKSPTHSAPRMRRASSIATSSPPTSSSRETRHAKVLDFGVAKLAALPRRRSDATGRRRSRRRQRCNLPRC